LPASSNDGDLDLLVGKMKAAAAPLREVLRDLHARLAQKREGRVADYIPELAKADPNWFGLALATADGRLREVDGIERHLAEWTAPQDATAVAAQLQAAGVDAHPVSDMQELLQDPQLAHRAHFVELAHPVVGRYVVEANGLRFSDAPMQFSRPAPLLAGDSEYVYRDLLGLAASEYDELAAAGVLS